jgi:alcohol dehydrogenase
MLPPVIRFNAGDPATRPLYEELAHAARLPSVDALVRRVEELLELADLWQPLSRLGVPDDALSQLADEAAKQWTAQFNPRPVSHADFVRLYEQAWG